MHLGNISNMRFRWCFLPFPKESIVLLTLKILAALSNGKGAFKYQKCKNTFDLWIQIIGMRSESRFINIQIQLSKNIEIFNEFYLGVKLTVMEWKKIWIATSLKSLNMCMHCVKYIEMCWKNNVKILSIKNKNET